MKKSAFTLIEIICAVSLLILVSVSLMNVSVYTLSSIKTNNTRILLTQSSDFLEEYIKKELCADKISLIDYGKGDYIVKYQTFHKVSGSSNKYILANKKLRLIKGSSVMIIDTENIDYIKNNDTYQKFTTYKEASNVIEENVKEIKVDMQDDKLYFDIVLEKNNIEIKLNFYIKNLKQKNFV